MSRAVKLFCVMGPLFILIAVISFLWPTFVIRQDLDKVEGLFTQETIKEQVNLAESRALLFKVKLNQVESLIKSSLLYVQENPSLQQSFESAITAGDSWRKAGQTLSYNTGIGLLEITKDKRPILAIAPQNALLYASKVSKLTDNVTYVLVDNYRGILDAYIGIMLAHDDSNITDPLSFYFLYPVTYFLPNSSPNDPEFPQNLRAFAKEITRVITTQNLQTPKGLMTYLAAHYSRHTVNESAPSGAEPSPKDLLSFYQAENSFFTSVRIREFIRTLLDGIDESPFENGSPYGIASLTINETNTFNGVAMLSSDLFFDSSLVDTGATDTPYLLIDNPQLKQVFMGAAADIATSSGHYTITLASSLSPLLSDLITSLEAIAIISEQGKPYVAINPTGLSLPHAAIMQISLKATQTAPYGLLEFNGQNYQFMELKPFDNSPLAIVILRPESADPLHTLHNTVINQLNLTSKHLAEQLLGINVGILLTALIILVVLSKAITRSIRQLAVATEHLAKGHYEGVPLPAVKVDERDELSILTEGFRSMIVALRDKEKMRAVLDKVVSKEIAAEILKGDVHLGGENRIVTVMFADIRHFTQMTENLEPQRLITFLNKFMTKMSVIIEDHYGVIDKYVGDEIMALYGAPHLDPEGAKKAVETALQMLDELKKWNLERAAEKFPEIAIGIGIHTGKVVAGNMGAENRLNYTVLGANVNLAARLCSKALPMQLLVSEQTLEACGLKEQLILEEIESMPLKGFSEPFKVFSIRGYKDNVHEQAH